jgi:hypothetical protein
VLFEVGGCGLTKKFTIRPFALPFLVLLEGIIRIAEVL